MESTLRLLACLILLLPALTATAAPSLPEHFIATFSVMSHGAKLGQTHWTLVRDGENRYRFESVTRASGLLSLFLSGERRESSLWQYRGNRLQPLGYRYHRSGRQGRSVNVRFDWEQGVAYNTSEGHTWKVEVESGTLDKLLYLLALMLDVRAGKTELTYTIADGGHPKSYHASVLGRETLSTRLGSLETLKVSSQPARGAPHTLLWLAPSLHYLPVQVEYRDQGENTLMTLESTEGLMADE
jgi:hypothetical protein